MCALINALRSGRRRWKKWSAPGTTTTGRFCGRAQAKTSAERDGFVVLAVDHEGVMADLGHRPLAGGAADEHEVARRMVTRGQRAGRARRDEAAEREPGERERQSRRHAARERRQGRDGIDQVDEVLGFAAAFVVRALAAADAAEVRSHREPSERREGPRHRRSHLVVERAAVQGVRMPDVGDAARRRPAPASRARTRCGRPRRRSSAFRRRTAFRACRRLARAS